MNCVHKSTLNKILQLKNMQTMSFARNACYAISTQFPNHVLKYHNHQNLVHVQMWVSQTQPYNAIYHPFINLLYYDLSHN